MTDLRSSLINIRKSDGLITAYYAVEPVMSPSESRVTILKQQLTCTNSFKILEILQNISMFLLKYKNNIQNKTCTYELNCLLSNVKALSKKVLFVCLLA